MRIRPYIDELDFAQLAAWLENPRTHALWSANCIPYPLTKENLRAFLDKDAVEWQGSAYVATVENALQYESEVWTRTNMVITREKFAI